MTKCSFSDFKIYINVRFTYLMKRVAMFLLK